MPAPIAVFAFNRPAHLQSTLDALTANEMASDSGLTIFCDGARNDADKPHVDAVNTVASRASGFASVRVVQREKNLGCAEAIIAGLTEMFEIHERLIVIEDDILTSKYTLTFLNSCLSKYQSYPSVFNISAWSPPPKLLPVDIKYPYGVYAIPRFNAWGWASWRDRFLLVDWEVPGYEEFSRSKVLQRSFNAGGDDLTPMLRDQMSGKINAWDIRMEYARFKHGMLGINPVKAYSTNIGCDGSGVHYTGPVSTRWDNDIELALAKLVLPDYVFTHKPIAKAFKKALSPPALWKRAINKLARKCINRNFF